ncbi:MAG: hypothetical protein MJK14_06240, partial [Rivularia sp. ALOHA_DT_140]|nr:hypothetical protein [Rivularia sp. ALOHA_DT_140]
MYSKKHLTKYKDYVIQPYYHSHQQPDKQWVYRVWDLQVINCPTVSQNFRAKPRRVVVSIDR